MPKIYIQFPFTIVITMDCITFAFFCGKRGKQLGQEKGKFKWIKEVGP